MTIRIRRKDTARFCKEVEALGWFPHRFTSSGHIQMRHTSGRLYIIPMSPSDHRSMRNALAALRRMAREAEQDT